MQVATKTIQIPPVLVLIFFVVLFIVLTPFVRSISFGLAFAAGLAFMFSFVAGAFVLDMLRADSPTVLTYDGLRKSRATVDSFLTTERDDHLPGMALIGYGGVRWLNIISADNSVLIVPSAAVEKLTDTLSLAYSPAVPLRKTEAVSGLFAGESDILAKAQDSSFNLKKGSSEVRFGLLNALLEQPTPDQMRQVQLYVDRSAMTMANLRDRVTLGEESNIRELRKLAATYEKESFFAAFKKWFTGHDDDRPSSQSPYSGDER